MPHKIALSSSLCFGLCISTVLHAQDRPTEADLFGGAGAAQTSEPAPSQPAQVAKPDPLTIGGQLYLRAQTTALLNQQIEDYRYSVPSMLDVYLDARANDRVRGFALGRMVYDPMQPDSLGAPSIISPGADGGTSGSASLSSLFGTQTNAAHVVLDQLWLRFDLWHTLFVTAGRQHVRWGTARFWTPSDFLHPRRRNPLDLFDARTGSDMIKVHLPIESNSWNFYVYAVNANQNDTPTLYSVAGAARAELVVGSNELGLGVLLRRGSQAKFAADLSMGLGPFDVYGEAALLNVGEIDRVRVAADATLPDPIDSSGSTADQVLSRIRQAVDTYYPAYRERGFKPQIVGGLTFTQKYNDSDTFTLGIEYFYNALGYSDPAVYPGLVFPHTNGLINPASFFYLGQHYAAAFLLVPMPGSIDVHTISLSALGNLSDRSFIARLDYVVTLLRQLRFEAFVSGSFGRPNGEFRFGLETPIIDDVRLTLQPMIFSAGLALRLSI